MLMHTLNRTVSVWITARVPDRGPSGALPYFAWFLPGLHRTVSRYAAPGGQEGVGRANPS